ncbi:Olfactory receptor 10A4 [Chelonia mydas]|uniref:Olfactory receptor 10A4 n=1 Tax=Chelonia mydas TaxID=8469 RepID=M7BZR0_CHEMY|nr:Olfactory receptor 10A4 [Chelonia mydas]
MIYSESDPGENQTISDVFILVGFSNLNKLQILLFLVLLVTYLVALMGNLLVILLIKLNPSLHTPMYFFLVNLSFLDICYTSSVVPQLLVHLLVEQKTINIAGCAAQMYIIIIMGLMECCLQAAMAYDRYVAICHPLHYRTIMSGWACAQLAGASWTIDISVEVAQTTWIFSLPFGAPSRIHHFFCNIPQVVKMARMDTSKNKIMVLSVGGNPTTTPPLSVDTCNGGVSRNREEDFVDEEEEEKEEEEDNAQLASCESVFPGSQDLFITLEPIPSEGRIPDPEAGEGTSENTHRDDDDTTSYEMIALVNFVLLQMTSSVSDPGENQTISHVFILEGFSYLNKLQILLFLLLLVIYLVTLIGNLLVILFIKLNPSLHTPMYFFLVNLSFLEICYMSSVVPQLLAHLLVEQKIISIAGCAAQMYIFTIMGLTECCLLAAMTYDCYIAICNPLHYRTIMSGQVCKQLAGASWTIGISMEVAQTMWIFSLPFCGSNRIHHFFCHIPPVVKMACTDTSKNQIVVLALSVLFIMSPFLYNPVLHLHYLHHPQTAIGRGKA